MTATFLTANDLRTGEIVFWTDRGVWSSQANQALLAQNEKERETLAQTLENPQLELEVVAPYLVTAAEAGRISLSPSFPKKLREGRRLAGPSPTLIPLEI